ncbi:MAG: hypothetical protein GC181_09800 [Bacteroidetes bacterium]|nr:hypothetical protein [Bacteroidota bacterium]
MKTINLNVKSLLAAILIITTCFKSASANTGTVNHKATFGVQENDLQSYINKNVIYPESLLETNATVDVQVRFVVDRNGRVKNAQIVSTEVENSDVTLSEDQLELFREAVLQVVKDMPLWSPASVNGVNVPSMYRLPVKFEIR